MSIAQQESVAFVAAVLGALRSVLPSERHPIGLHEPVFGGNEWRYVKECLDTGWVSSVGQFVDRFEAQLAEFTGAQHAIAVVNGTAALHTCLNLIGVSEGDEVVVPTLTFVATANAVAYCGAMPHFVDSEERTLGMDPSAFSEYLLDIAKEGPQGCYYNRITGRRIRAVVPMHTFGHPVDIDPLLEVCARYRLTLIEDAAESLGSWYKGRHTGTFGPLAVLSFNGNKVVTTGGGGAILTNDPVLARQAKHITTTARLLHRWAFFHDQVGYNYRLPNINAALGCAQLEQLPVALEKKRALARCYAKAFAGVHGLRFFDEPPFARSNFWLNTLLLDEAHSDQRDALLEATDENGIMTRPAWTLMHRLPAFVKCPRMPLPIAESLERRIVNIPSSASLRDAPAALM